MLELAEEAVDEDDGEVNGQDDGHHDEVVMQVVPGGNGTFLDAGYQGLEELYHTGWIS